MESPKPTNIRFSENLEDFFKCVVKLVDDASVYHPNNIIGEVVGKISDKIEVSRSFGNFKFKSDSSKDEKNQAVNCVPFAFNKGIKRKHQKNVVVIANNGLWSVMKIEEVGNFVRKKLQKNWSIKKIADELIKECKKKNKSSIQCIAVTIILLN